MGKGCPYMFYEKSKIKRKIFLVFPENSKILAYLRVTNQAQYTVVMHKYVFTIYVMSAIAIFR